MHTAPADAAPAPADAAIAPAPAAAAAAPRVADAALLAAALDGLTPAQRQAATDLGGPLLVVAGPGSGKTRTLTARLAYLIAAGHARPDELLAVTFTRKAAEEVRGRLLTLLGPRANAVQVGTFHAVAAGLCPGAGPSPLLGEGERAALIRRAAADHGIEPRRLHAALTQHKADPDAPVDAALAPAIAGYERLRRALGARDLDDLLLDAVAALREGTAPTSPVRHLLVDEYQDVSAVQRALCRALAGPQRAIFAIGDPDQAIYGFRGADVAHFLAFAQDFPGARVVALAQNFRSTATLVRAAAAVIGHNRQRHGDIAMAPTRPDGAAIALLVAGGEAHEAAQIAAEIERLVGGTSLHSFDSGRASTEALGTACHAFCDIAVLARTGARADALAAALTAAGIPVQRPRRGLLDGEAARDLCAYLRLCAPGAREDDPQLLGALLRVVGREAPGAAAAWLRALAASAAPFATPPAPASPPGLDPAAWVAVGQRCAELRALPPPARVDELARALTPPDDVLALLRARAEGGEAALLHLARLGRDDSHEADELDLRAERVAVLTCHGAKGLEFPVVFVAGCEAALFPGSGATDPTVEEERRLFYVAMTRARERLYLSRVRGGPGGPGAAANPGRLPSPFLDELPAACVAAPPVAPAARPRTRQMKLF